MTDKAISSMTASVFLDEVRSSISGSSTFEPSDGGDKWIYLESKVSTDSAKLISSGVLESAGDYFESPGTAISDSDKVLWLAVKVSDTSGAVNHGVCICLDGDNAAYDATDGIFLEKDEMTVFKTPNATVGDIYATCVKFTDGSPSANSVAITLIQIAAILDDV